MSLSKTLEKTIRCSLKITNNARRGIQDWSTDEHDFFRLQESYLVHIEKKPVNAHGNVSLSIFFDNESTNSKLTEKLGGKVAVLECVLQNDGFLATAFYIKGGNTPVKTNRRLTVALNFVTTKNNGAGLPITLHTMIRELPVAEERSEYVKKRISSWEGYLKIQERNADISDITSAFTHLNFNEDFSRMTIHGNQIEAKEWNKLRGLSASIKGVTIEAGDVLKADKSKRTIEVELRPKFREMARRNQVNSTSKEIVFSNFATLSQIRRLRKGFEDLQNGLAANPNLDKILFENKPTVHIHHNKEELVFHNRLNEYQREAVIGAVSSEDLYVIQGPPGTGKTTVISEICQQNAKAGLKTLVASQSNLAVDNALSRLLSNKDIRILRFGRTESIEEEGKKFIEENVGAYWKEQTLLALQKDIQEHPLNEGKLKKQLEELQKDKAKIEQQITMLQEKIVEKANAQEKFAELLSEIKILKKSLIVLKKAEEEEIEEMSALQEECETAKENIRNIESFFESQLTAQELTVKLQQLSVQIAEINRKISYQETIITYKKVEEEFNKTKEEYRLIQLKSGQSEQLAEQVNAIKKYDELKNKMEQMGIIPTSLLSQQMVELERLIENIQSFSDWREVNSRLAAAIDYLEQTLTKRKVSVENILQNAGRSGVVYDSSYTVKEIHQFMDRMKSMISSEDDMGAEKLSILLEGCYVRRKFVWKQGEILQQAKRSTTTKYQAIKLELTRQIRSEALHYEPKKRELANKSMAYSQRLEQLKTQLAQTNITSSDGMPALDELKSSLEGLLQEEKDVKMIENTVTKYTTQLAGQKERLANATIQIEKLQLSLENRELEIKKVNATGLELERSLRNLEGLIKSDPESELESKKIDRIMAENQMKEYEQRLVRLPITQALQNEWAEMLEDANDHDLEEIRKLYVRHANVIGTTCVASARKEFMENYPTFDVVIIDEVSKATPPELLLPMLKGKKIILVGDHHQLPPLVGEDTLEETLQAILEESNNFEEKEELKKLLKESLFERLFKNLPTSHKTMLAIQYRMHENIMQTITPFYEEENYHLQCGLTDSDGMRDHLLESRYVKRQDHLLWLDMPNESRFFEERMKDGKSRFNQAELDKIRDILFDLDKATETAIKEGRMTPGERKSVGVISFYGEQVKRIDRLVQQETSLKYLHIRTGTVDKFQGMEMDVIILSMVRNNQEKSGDIGFANDYRRLNVALSRARELLMLVGSTEMFTKRAKQRNSREMYGRLLKVVKSQNGLRTVN